jgi:MFS family permease
MERWSLVCGNMPYFKSLVQSLYFAGTFVAAMLAGMLSDWFGRKKAFLVCLVPAIGILFATYFTGNLYIWLFLRFCNGAAVMACNLAITVYGVSNLNFPQKTRINFNSLL